MHSHNQQAALLYLVSETLQSLELVSVPSEGSAISDARTSLDVALLELNHEGDECGDPLSFPRLTHLTIGYDTIQYVEFIPAFCEWALNLRYLDINLSSNSEDVRDLKDRSRLELDWIDSITKITELRLEFCESAYHEGHHCQSSIFSLISKSPQLQTLYVNWADDTNDEDD